MSPYSFIPSVYVSSHLIYIPCPHIRSYQVCMYLRILSIYHVPILVHTNCVCIFASYLHTMSPYSFIPSVYVSSHLIYIPCPRIRSYPVCMYLLILSTNYVPIFVHIQCVGMFTSVYIPCPHIRSYPVCRYVHLILHTMSPYSFIPSVYVSSFLICIPCPLIRSNPVCRYVHLNLHTMSRIRSYQVCMYLLILSTYYVPIFVHTQYVGMLTSTYIPCSHIRSYPVYRYVHLNLHAMSQYTFIPSVYVSSHLIYIPCPHIRSYQVCRYVHLYPLQGCVSVLALHFSSI